MPLARGVTYVSRGEAQFGIAVVPLAWALTPLAWALTPLAWALVPGKPVLKIIPYTRDPEEALRALRGTVIRYVEPLEPVGLEDWESTDLETVALSTDPELLELIQNSRSRHARDGGLSSAEMRRRLEEDLQD